MDLNMNLQRVFLSIHCTSYLPYICATNMYHVFTIFTELNVCHVFSNFSKVLALPSENWSDYADMWFCHKHDDDSNGPTKEEISNMLIPKDKQCMVGDSYFLVQEVELKLGHTVTKGDHLQCQRCGAQIGVKYNKKNKKGAFIVNSNAIIM